MNKPIGIKKECVTCAKINCPVHPEYGTKEKPRCSCEVCWEIWEKKQNEK